MASGKSLEPKLGLTVNFIRIGGLRTTMQDTPRSRRRAARFEKRVKSCWGGYSAQKPKRRRHPKRSRGKFWTTEYKALDGLTYRYTNTPPANAEGRERSSFRVVVFE
jgi:hypothetical protein